MSAGYRIGSFIGNTAARTVHYSTVAVESTGEFGRDIARGAREAYPAKRADLAAARAAKYAAIAATFQAKVEAPKAAPEVFRGRVPLTTA